jgi:hypothetical protein
MHELSWKRICTAEESKGEAICVPTRDTRVLKSCENELRAAAEKLLQPFRAGDAFSIGEDGKNYTLAGGRCLIQQPRLRYRSAASLQLPDGSISRFD